MTECRCGRRIYEAKPGRWFHFTAPVLFCDDNENPYWAAWPAEPKGTA